MVLQKSNTPSVWHATGASNPIGVNKIFFKTFFRLILAHKKIMKEKLDGPGMLWCNQRFFQLVSKKFFRSGARRNWLQNPDIIKIQRIQLFFNNCLLSAKYRYIWVGDRLLRSLRCLSLNIDQYASWKAEISKIEDINHCVRHENIDF